MKYKNTEFVVEQNALLLEYLFAKITNKSKNNIKSLLARGNVLVNGKVITQYNYQLHKKQTVIIKWGIIQDEKRQENIDIIYEDDDMIVINKPAGLLSISTEDDKERTAYHMVMEYVKHRNSQGRVFIVHRLDRDTSGVLLIAKNEKTKFTLQDKWNDIVTTRGYIAIVEGKLDKTSGTIKSWLKETTTQLVYSSHKPGDGKEAVTHYNVLKDNDRYSLLDIKIDTGRKNQIRVHMKDIGHYVIGDKKYGSQTNPLKRLGLHANILEFQHPITKKIMHFEAPMPKEFRKLF
jgi:23S rRNA pseudouridine1911/1915/1917 synthase